MTNFFLYVFKIHDKLKSMGGMKMEDTIKEISLNESFSTEPLIDAYDLEINQESFDLLMGRIELMDLYNDYTRIIFFFEEFLLPEMRERIISKGKDVFCLEATKDWS